MGHARRGWLIRGSDAEGMSKLEIQLPKRIPELDGFRGIAVLMVMVEHVYEAGPSISLPGPLNLIVSHGWLGVDLFFVLSGFLITGILLDERERSDYFQSFYRRRACRILPLAVTVLLLCALVSGFAHDDRTFTSSVLLTLAFCSNLQWSLGILAIPGTGVMWSLAVEEHFYLLWPLAVRRFPRMTIGYLAAAIVLLSPIARALAIHHGVRPMAVYQLSWFRFDGLALGALLAIFVRSRYFTTRNTWALASGWLAMVVAMTLILRPYGVSEAKSMASEAMRYTQAQALFGSAMAVALAHHGTAGTRFLRSRFLGWAATLSYCLYLIHMPVGASYVWVLHHAGITVDGLAGVLSRYAVIFPVSFALAALSGKYLEAPFMRMRFRKATQTAALA